MKVEGSDCMSLPKPDIFGRKLTKKHYPARLESPGYFKGDFSPVGFVHMSNDVNCKNRIKGGVFYRYMTGISNHDFCR